jgi:hypothetical protein
VATKYVTEAAFGDAIEKMGELTRKAIQEEMAKALKWQGTWRPGNAYAENDCVQDKSSLWVCVAPTTAARPGTGAGWRQMTREKAK